MPETWYVDAPPQGTLLPGESVAALLDAADHDDPAAAMHAAIRAIVPVQYLSIVTYSARAGDEPPRLAGRQAANEHGCGRDVTTECFEVYRRRFWRNDEATRIAARLQNDGHGAGLVALRLRASDVPVGAWRAEIYEREHLTDRLTFVYLPVPRHTYAINLYRDEAQGRFGHDEITRLLAAAPLLQRAHRNALRADAAARGAQPALTPERARAALSRIAPELSTRELEVCAWIACGVGADGIAAELDVAPSTVATLRKRAYAKLVARGVLGGRMRLAQLARG